MIVIEDVHLRQGDFVLKDLNLTVPARAYAVLMGRSGCGKTTLAETLCGLRPILGGTIRLSGRDVTRCNPALRGVGYVPQDRALFPTMVVRDQLAFSLVVRKLDEETIARRVEALAQLLEIGHLLDRMPNRLSGGEAQRVALGRALACNPSVLCLDEPLSALDEELHEEICILLTAIHLQTEVTVLHITHSMREAKRLGDLRFRLENSVIQPLD